MATLAASGLSPSYLAEDKGHVIVAVAAAFIVADIIFTTLRFAARRKCNASFGWDDYLIIPSLLSNLAIYGLSISMVQFAGLGRHQADLIMEDPKKPVLWAKCLYAMELLYLLSTALPRLSVLCLYCRIFPFKLGRRASHSLAAVIVCYVIVSLISSHIQCEPFAYQWDKSILGGSCSKQLSFNRWVFLPCIPIDVAILVFPIPIIWKLQLAIHRKLSIIILFTIGNLCFALSCVRFSYFFIENPFAEDGTWTSFHLVLWTIVDSGIYLEAACLPTLWPLVFEAFRKIGSGMVSGSQRLDFTGKHLRSQAAPHSDMKSLVGKGWPKRDYPRDLNEGEVNKGAERDHGLGNERMATMDEDLVED